MLRMYFVACAQVLLHVLLLVLVVENLHDGNGAQNQPQLGFSWVLRHPTRLRNEPAGADGVPRLPKLLLMLQMMPGKGGALADLYWGPTRCRGLHPRRLAPVIDDE